MPNYCITHGVETIFDIADRDCVIVSCPPPEVGLTYDEVSQLVEPSEQELLLMDVNAKELEADFIGSQL